MKDSTTIYALDQKTSGGSPNIPTMHMTNKIPPTMYTNASERIFLANEKV
jgi:hypothetical protein